MAAMAAAAAIWAWQQSRHQQWQPLDWHVTGSNGSTGAGSNVPAAMSLAAVVPAAMETVGLAFGWQQWLGSNGNRGTAM
jgi:hypothetical protein